MSLASWQLFGSASLGLPEVCASVPGHAELFPPAPRSSPAWTSVAPHRRAPFWGGQSHGARPPMALQLQRLRGRRLFLPSEGPLS